MTLKGCGIIFFMKRYSGLFSLLLIILCISLAACHPAADNSVEDDGRLRIITTIPPLYSFAKNIVGELAYVENLLPSGAGPHDYAFKPGDIKRLADADVLIKNGLGLESWLGGLMGFAGDGLKVIDSSKGVTAINDDPHIWLSPKNAGLQVINITEALIKADPENAAAYRKNSDDYIKKLDLLNDEIDDQVARWSKRDFVSYHSAFLYFTRDYRLRHTGVIKESPEKEPTPADLADIIDKINEAGIKAIFADLGPIPEVVKMLAKDLGLKVYRLDTMEAGELSAEAYEESMRANLLVMQMALDEYYSTSGENK